MKNALARFQSSILLMAALAFAACAGDDVSAPGSDLTPQLNSTPTIGVLLAKRGPLGSTATFSISATGGNLPAGSTVTLNACPLDTTIPCETALVWTPANDNVESVTITEIATTGNIVFAELGVSRTMNGVLTGWLISAPAAPTTTFEMNGTADALVRFKNVEGPPQDPALRVTKTAVTPVVNIGSPMTFSMTVYSDGPGTATNVTLSDPLPVGMDIVWSTSSAGCAITGTGAQTLNCSFGDLAAGQSRTVTVTGTTSDKTGCSEYPNTATVNASNHASIEASATIEVTGCTRDGFQGCTPGYWKQKQHFGNWGTYVPTGPTASQYNTVFGVNLMASGTTLLTALSTGGGGVARFGRHSTAALLSAGSGIDYGMSAADVIAAVQQAVASGNLDSWANEFERRNERQCPLGRAGD